MEQINQQRSRGRRGFAAMSPERQKEIASAGGRAAHEQGVAHKWNSEEARNAGKKGGLARRSTS
ncbi:MAG: KGG domain-containing protein [Flavisolibacter sp.]